MSSLISRIVKNSHIFPGIYFIFLKIHPTPNLKGFQYQIGRQIRDRKRSYQERQVLAVFCKRSAVILG